jgi:uncharacterized protein YndB with AHSA1/START domain
MQSQNFTSGFTVSQSPDEVFAAVVDVPRWWTGDVEGKADKLGGEFTYRYEDAHYSKQRITELIPGRKVVWLVTDAYLKGPDDPSEWIGTEITFEISPKDGQTELRFTHLGLAPELECFESCSNAWGFYINSSLRRLITTGEGPASPPWAVALRRTETTLPFGV